MRSEERTSVTERVNMTKVEYIPFMQKRTVCVEAVLFWKFATYLVCESFSAISCFPTVRAL